MGSSPPDAMRIEALCLTLCLSLALVAAHPSGLECGNDNTTRLSVGQTIMGNKVVAAPADAPVKLSINGDDVTVTAPAGTYFALKSFGKGAKLTLSDKEAHMAPSENCTNQIYTNTTSTTYTLKQHGATRLVVGYNIGANSGSAPTVALVSAGSLHLLH